MNTQKLQVLLTDRMQYVILLLGISAIQEIFEKHELHVQAYQNLALTLLKHLF
jgi:hypothetical protein